MSSKSTEEPKQTLPVGHPQAGYVSPDLSGSDGAGTIPESEKKWNEARDKAREAELEAVAAHEDEVAKAEQEEALAEDKPAAKAAPKPASSSSGS